MLRTARFAAILACATLLAPSVAFADVSISAAGSTALQPLVQAAAEAYQARNPDVKISITGGGSRTGLALAASGSADIGNSDILASKEQTEASSDGKKPGLVDHKVCAVGFAVVVHPDNGVKNLTKAQIQDIFGGKIKNWKDVGGKDLAITVINRPASSGTRAVFVKTIMGKAELSRDTLVEDATGTVVQKITQTAGTISYASFSGTHGKAGINELSIDGIAPTEENIETGKYPFWSYEHMYTSGPPNKDVSRFLAFVQSNSALVRKLGYILTRDIQKPENDR